MAKRSTRQQGAPAPDKQTNKHVYVRDMNFVTKDNLNMVKVMNTEKTGKKEASNNTMLILLLIIIVLLGAIAVTMYI